MGTPVEDSTGQPELWKRGESYGMKTLGRIDGQNVLEVYETVQEAVAYAREHGPVLIEAITYRYRGHGVSDRQYNERLSDELEEWKANKDPITILCQHIKANYKNVDSDLEQIETEARKIVDESVVFAEQSPDPTYDDLINNVYVE
jgi:pyruvate dehydrogenase E1 component alpha subunit